MRCPNVIEIDATIVGSSSTLVPRDLSNSDLTAVPDGYDFGELDAYEFGSRRIAPIYGAKVVNDSDASVDAQLCVSTPDDDEFEDYATDGSAQSVATGTPPDNVALLEGDTPAALLNVDLTASTAPTADTITIVFANRLHGGA